MSYMLSKYSRQVLGKLNSIRKISKSISSDDLDVVLNYLDAINCLQEFDEMLGGIPIDKIRIPSKLSVFIQPKTVRIDTADRGDVDFMLRNEMPKEIPSYTRFIEACDVIASAMKTSISSYQTVDEIRKNVSLVSVYRNSINDGGYVVYDGSNPYIPVTISFDGVERHVRRFTVDDMMNDFIQWKLPEIFK